MMAHSLKSFAVSALLVTNLTGFASTASALPAIDRLAIKNASPRMIESVQWGWGWAAPAVAAGVVAGAVVGSALAAPYYYFGAGPYYDPYHARPYYAPAPAGYYVPGYYGPPSSEDAVAYCIHRFRSLGNARGGNASWLSARAAK